MLKIFKIGIRNLLRYKRRSLMTSLLIVLGIVLVIVFTGVSSSFKNMMIGQITDSMLGHLQIHRKGYVSSIDNMPLHLNIKGEGLKKIEQFIIDNKDFIESYTMRLKFGAMLSNFEQTTNIRLNGVSPEMEAKTCPDLVNRFKSNTNEPQNFLNVGEIIIPENLAKGMKLTKGSEIVLVATNQDGSVNGISLKVAGIVEGLVGPGGRDGYVHIDDARTLLRINGNEINEIAVRIENFDDINSVRDKFESGLSQILNKNGQPSFELHDWASLSPFSNIASMVDILIITIKIVLVSIVLISILNVMMMSVYERVSEIGTISAIGTIPSKILSLFVAEGFSLGLFSTIIGNIMGILVLYIINVSKIHFAFGRMTGLLLKTSISPGELLTVSVLVLLLTIIASLQPALKASKMEPVDALRHV